MSLLTKPVTLVVGAFEPSEPIPGIDPLWVAVGAPDAPPRDDSLPMPERPDER